MEQKAEGTISISFKSFWWRVMATHSVAYLFAGLIAQISFNYENQFSTGFLETFMRPITSPMVAWGAALQLVNGFFMSLFLYPIRREILGNFKLGWKKLILLIIGFTVFAPQIPGPGNLEGLIYTKIPVLDHIIGFPETILYALFFSLGLINWYKYDKKWIKQVSIIFIILILLMSVLAYLDSIGALPKQ